MCEFCGCGPSCGICGRGLRRGSPWGDRARRVLSYLVDGAALVLLAVAVYLAAGCAAGVSP